MKQLFQFALSPLSGVLLSCGIAHAEGTKPFTGAFGVNRVVRSDASATAPRLTTSGSVTISFVQPVNVNGKFDVEVNPYNNKATAYLGGSALDTGNVVRQYDAGLQFETGVFGNNAPGWSAFFSRDNNFVNAHVWDGSNDVAWTPSPIGWAVNKDTVSGKYINTTGSIGSNLTFTIARSGACNAIVSAINLGNNTFYWNPKGNNSATDLATTATEAHPIAPWGAPAYNSANQNAATVKRVSGMTRSVRHAELDGSQMGAVWSNCTLNGGAWVEVKADGSTVSHVDQAVTGYDSLDGTSALAYDRRLGSAAAAKITAESRTITQFVVTGLTNDQARSKVDGVYKAARYTNETVNMNMGTATALEGDQLEWN